mgnify:CR=1 FL=1
MNSFAEHVTADRRLVVLRLLEQAPDYRGNAFLLQRALDGFGHAVGMDRLGTDLAWLAEQDLLKLIATLTQRGADVAHGRVVVPGVARPAPAG